MYFKNQAELVRALCEEVYGEFADVLEEVLRTTGSPLARLRAALQDYIDFGFGDSPRHRLVFMTSLASHVDASRPLEQGRQARRAADTFRQLSARCCARRSRGLRTARRPPAGPSRPGTKGSPRETAWR